MHSALFNSCDMCKGKGYIDDPSLICYGCNGAKGTYSVFTYKDFVEDICKPLGVMLYAEDYFKLLKQSKIIDQDSNKAFDIKHSQSGTWKIMVDLKSRAVNQLYELITKLFEVDEANTRPPSIGTAYEDINANER